MAETRRAKRGPEYTPDVPPAADLLRVLKKYPNRRLYDTRESSYITLADVKKMVLSGEDFVVRDARSSEDLTRAILLQIILEEETGGLPMFSSQTLAQIIRFYGHAMQGVMGSYLEKNMQAFTDMQSRLVQPAIQPAVSGLMSNYLEQSKSVLQQMQEQMAKQAELLFKTVPGLVPPKR